MPNNEKAHKNCDTNETNRGKILSNANGCISRQKLSLQIIECMFPFYLIVSFCCVQCAILFFFCVSSALPFGYPSVVPFVQLITELNDENIDILFGNMRQQEKKCYRKSTQERQKHRTGTKMSATVAACNSNSPQ